MRTRGAWKSLVITSKRVALPSAAEAFSRFSLVERAWGSTMMRVESTPWATSQSRLGLAVVAGDDNGGGGGDVATGDYQATGEGGAW